MAKYKNGRDVVLGDEVVGVDAKGQPVAGKLVMIHQITGQEPKDIAVSQNFKLIGDLKAADFLHKSDVTAPAGAVTDPPKK